MKPVNGFDGGGGVQFSLSHLDQTLDITLEVSDAMGGMLHAEQTLTSVPGSWSLKAIGTSLNPDDIEDLGIVCYYAVTVRTP